MRKYITSDINTAAHIIQKTLKCSWEFAFNTATKHDPEVLMPFISDIWHSDDARALADHFWGLHRAYEEIHDRGRSITMLRAAKAIYRQIDTQGSCGLDVLCEHGLSTSVAEEAFEFYSAGISAQLTPRSRSLILDKFALGYAHRAKVPLWDVSPTSPRNRGGHTSIH
jgi:hypothetical protein